MTKNEDNEDKNESSVFLLVLQLPSPFADRNSSCFQFDIQCAVSATDPAGLSPGIMVRNCKSNPIPPSQA